MKLYLFDTINRYKRYSETLDVKTKICNRPWIVFNDGGEKEVYKFKEDGAINIVLSGRVTRGTWEYDPADKTIIISASDQSYMVHPGMYDDMLLALQVDGTDQCAFLIEENNSKNFAPKTYSELMLFFEEKEKKRIEEENWKIIQIEQKKKEDEKKKEEETIIEEFDNLQKWELRKIVEMEVFLLFLITLGIVVSFICIGVFIEEQNNYKFLLTLLTCIVGIILFAITITIYSSRKKIAFGKCLDEFVNLPQYKDKINDKLLNKLKEVNQLN